MTITEAKDWLDYQHDEGYGIICRNCKHWKIDNPERETNNTGECKHFRLLCEAMFYCGDFEEGDTE